MEYLEIRLESEMCAASGESSGNSVDSDICVNSCGLPYIPARRIKGCLRAAAENLRDMGLDVATQINIDLLFGNEFGQEGLVRIFDAVIEEEEIISSYLKRVRSGDGNSKVIRKAAHPIYIENIFTSVLGQTKMKDGVKVDNTLRFTRVLNQYDPLKEETENHMAFFAPIDMKPLPKNLENSEYLGNELRKLMESSCKALRHMGLNRNRGLGNVSVRIIQCASKLMAGDWKQVENEIDNLECTENDQIEISYFITLDAPVSIQSTEGCETDIPGRSVIGCMSGRYLRENDVDTIFEDLFLNGTVIWSPLTPVIDCKISDPTPLMLVELKNAGKKKVNRYTQLGTQWKSQKPKTMEGSYSVMDENGYIVAKPLLGMSYHHSIRKEKLYTQKALEKGLTYGGTIKINGGRKDLAREVISLLQKGNLQFGRSKGAQYSTCSLKKIDSVRCLKPFCRSVTKLSEIFVVLRTDMIVKEQGRYCTDLESVRRVIARSLKEQYKVDVCMDPQEEPQHPQGYIDLCRYRTVCGFQTMWHLQKAHIPAVGAGSVYCFLIKDGNVPKSITVGENIQEGFGNCSILTLEEQKKYNKIEDGDIDIATFSDDDDRIRQLNSAMRVYVAKEVLRRYAREYVVKDRNIPISRLRLMLSEAKTYEDLLERVDSMKTSDRSSENVKGKRATSQELLQDFYGNGKDGHLLGKILRTESGLYEELEKDHKAFEIVQKMWKLPLNILLHNMHYKREG